MKISIIIPFLNEAENLNFLLNKLYAYLKELGTKFDYKFEVVFVDDGSTDNSYQIIKNYKQFPFPTQVIRFAKNFGSHAALRAGIMNASGDYITFLYADLEDPMQLIPELVSNCQQGNDITWAVRESTKAGFLEKIFSRFYARLMKKFVSKNFPEKGFDVVIFSNKVQKYLNENMESNSSLFLQILTMGFKQNTITYKKSKRARGKSKWTLKKKIKLFIDSFIAFSYAPIRLVSIIGIIFFLVGFFWTLYIILREIIVGDLPSGWPALTSILLMGLGITNISLGIIAEYLWRTLDASKNKPVFIIDEIINL
jgi:dolichol-phosphate mannosyltransferase